MTSVAVSGGTLSVGARTLCYETRTSPTASGWLVFSNSILTNLSIWEEQVDMLAGRWNLLTYDQAGHGRSSVPLAALTMADLGQDLLALLDHLAVQRCVAIGLSMGVPTVLSAFGRQPKRFAALVFVDGQLRTAPGGAEAWKGRIDLARQQGMPAMAASIAARWLPGEPEDSRKSRQLRDMMASTHVEGFSACAHALRSYDLSAAAATINVPVLAVAGALDGVMPQSMEASFAQHPGADFIVIADAGHIPNFQRPAAFNAALNAFLINLYKS